MSITVREYGENDIKGMISIWNEVVPGHGLCPCCLLGSSSSSPCRYGETTLYTLAW